MVSSEQRRKQLARDKHRRQLERRAQRRRRARMRNIGIAAGAVVVLSAFGAYAATGGFASEEENKAEEAPSPSPSSKAPDPCGKPAKGKPNGKTWKKEPAMKIDTSADYTMELATTCGDITLDLDAEKAPHTVNSFDFLTGEDYFDHTPCHRLLDDRLLQCGDPKGTGEGDPGYTIPDENLKDPRLKGNTYPAGTVAMANRYDAQADKGRDSGGSQFFLVFEDTQLPPDYTPFGKITGGMDVLKKIAKAGSVPDPQTGNTAPNATVVIDKAEVRKG